MLTRLIVSRNCLRVEKRWRITRADIRPVTGPTSRGEGSNIILSTPVDNSLICFQAIKHLRGPLDLQYR
ncbi:hypothetical protein F2P79_009121 [Pimephales promelas]|nr:hypothetical protein F2P79_009121 [Pimephales promelas]